MTFRFTNLGTTTTIAVLALASATTACGRRQTTDTETPQAAGPPPPPPGAGAPAPATGTAQQGISGQGAGAPAKPALPEAIVIKDAGFATPESVLYDAEEDVYLVSNINGKPMDSDGNGFISKVGPDGKVVALKWIDGSTPGVTLDAPKGMAISGPYLYVSDIKWIRVFDRKTGKAAGKFAVPGASFANDMSTAPDGTVYVTDTGWKAAGKGFEPTGTDAVHRMKGGAAKPLLKDKGLGSPNGVLADDEGVWYVTAGGELGRIGKDGKKKDVQKLPQAGLDGIIRLSDGSIAVSSWKASGIYRGTPGGEFSLLIENVPAPADIGYDTKRNRVLIPMFNDNTVRIQPLPDLPAPQTVATAPKPAAPAAKPGAQPATPAQPAKPAAGSAKPATPATAAKPATPATAAKPATPAKPKQSAAAEEKTGATPAKPATPATPPATK